MEYTHQLMKLGLSEKESIVYLSLLKSGIASAYRVAVDSGLKRPTAYLILDELVQRNIAILVPRSKKKMYRAIPPKQLINRKTEELQKVEALLPELAAIANTDAHQPHVQLFEGVRGVTDALTYGVDAVSESEVVGFYATNNTEISEQYENFAAYQEALKKNNVRQRGIVPDAPELTNYRDQDTQLNRTMKTVDPDNYNSSVAFETGGNWVKIYDLENQQALVIENSAIASGLKQIFEMQWNALQ